ncbi:glutathione S-transferase [Camillea tinctor]|nr:glutathione S-transferase [Camillea tinctor]
MTLTVHHLGVSQSDRVVWLCEELGIDYVLKKYDRSPVMAPEAYKALHPIGSAPVIEDGPLKLAESGACVEYIAQIYGKGSLVVQPGAKNYADYLYWFHFGNGSLVPAVMYKMVLASSGASPVNEAVQRYGARLQRLLALLDQRLGEVPWLAGDEFTCADIMNLFALTTARCFQPLDLSEYKNIVAYLKRVSGREGYRRAMKKGDPDQDIEALTGAAPPPIFKGYAALQKE